MLNRRRAFWLLATSLAISFAAAGCASGSLAAGDAATLRGTFVMKGNAPFAQPTLIVGESHHWELQDAPKSAIDTLQNKMVIVRGVVVRAKQTGMLLPVLKVASMQPADSSGGKSQR